MVDPKLAFIAAALALTAAPAFAQDDSRPDWQQADRAQADRAQAACDRCAAPQAHWASQEDRTAYASQSGYVRQSYSSRSETVTRTSYSESFLSWPGKGGRGEAVEESEYGPGPDGAACPPVRPGERVISCRYHPFTPPADITPMTGVLFADGGVGPEFIPSGGGGGGGVTIIGGGNASSSSSASASAFASASISIDARFGGSFHHRGGYGPGPKGCGCTTTSGYGGMSGWGGGHAMGGGSHGHGRR